MKASDLKPGDVIKRCPDEPELEGWTVSSRIHAGAWVTPGTTEEWDSIVLLELERRWYIDRRKYHTRSAWLPADAEVEVE